MMNHKFFENPDEIKGFSDKIYDDIITLACTADLYYRMYNKLIKAIELEYGKKVLDKIKAAAVLATFDDVYNYAEKLEKEDGKNG